MKIISLIEAQGKVGEVVSGVCGTITKLFPRKTGTNANGDWSMQGGQLQDDAGTQMDFTLSGREDLNAALRGKKVYMTSVLTKNGMQGVKVKEEEYKGQTKVKLWITPTCTIADTSPKETHEGQSEAKPATKVSVSSSPSDYSGAKRKMMQYANLYELARSAAEYLGTQFKFDEETTRTCTSCLFIQGAKDGLLTSMPEKPVGKKKDIDEPQDEPWDGDESPVEGKEHF